MSRPHSTTPVTPDTPRSAATSAVTYGRDLLAVAKAHQLPFLAAAIAYYTFVAVVPLLIVGFAVTSALAGEALADRIVMAVGEFLTPEASSLLESALLGDSGRGGVTAVVAAFLRLSDTPLSGLLGTLGMFVVLPVVLLPLYYVFPSRPVTVTEALPGAVFAGLVLLVGDALNVMRRPYETGNYNNHRYEYPSNEGP